MILSDDFHVDIYADSPTRSVCQCVAEVVASLFTVYCVYFIWAFGLTIGSDKLLYFLMFYSGIFVPYRTDTNHEYCIKLQTEFDHFVELIQYILTQASGQPYNSGGTRKIEGCPIISADQYYCPDISIIV